MVRKVEGPGLCEVSVPHGTPQGKLWDPLVINAVKRESSFATCRPFIAHPLSAQLCSVEPDTPIFLVSWLPEFSSLGKETPCCSGAGQCGSQLQCCHLLVSHLAPLALRISLSEIG